MDAPPYYKRTAAYTKHCINCEGRGYLVSSNVNGVCSMIRCCVCAGSGRISVTMYDPSTAIECATLPPFKDAPVCERCRDGEEIDRLLKIIVDTRKELDRVRAQPVPNKDDRRDWQDE